jgi:tRNA-2-methylthio-N6-dimethylallyladenosine synthase
VATPRTFLIKTFGCQMNEHDSERLAGRLVAEGMSAATSEEGADVVVFNTCTIRENADLRLYSALGHLKALKARRPDLQIAVGGCMAQKDRGEILRRAPWVDLVVGTHNLGDVPYLLERAKVEGPLVEVRDAPDPEAARDAAPALYAVRELDFAAWITIQTGCDNTCAYCIVPAVRGPEISRPFEDLVAEARALAERGVSEVTLLGQNVNSYGRDITGRRPLFGDLLRAVGEVAGIERVRFTSPHPKDLRPETIAAMAETPAVCPQLHLPLQSGSDRVLALMRRGYRASRYLEKLAAARAAIPDLAVTTDLIVGFPGETERDFDETLAVVAEARYDGAFTFVFSPREGTRAAQMTEDAVPDAVIRDRFARLKEVLDRSTVRRHEARVGLVEEVLVEGVSKRNEAMWSGRTRQGKLTHFAPGERAPRPGALVSVRVTHGAPYYLTGELVAELRGPRHRSRIPVAVS